MNKSVYHIIGVMSGTSLDGIDLAHIRFEVNQDKWSFTLLNTMTVPYSTKWQHKLKDAINLNHHELEAFDERYTVYLATTIQSFISANSITELDAVCSHGHTVFHRPDLGYTVQIGNIGLLADILQHKVICDFRVQDVLLGGQGAPLVPIGDSLLFSEYEACLNLGGFANVSYEDNSKNRIAYDICPVNVLLNGEAQKLGGNYDNKGKWASSGVVCDDLLNELNALPFYTTLPPRSLGIEFLDSFIYPLVERYQLEPKELLATYVEHIAMQIGQRFRMKGGTKILVTGGGAYNDYLMERIRFYGSDMVFEIPEKETIDFKEALIFGLLGVLKLRNQVNVLASVTGAKYDHCSGKVWDFYQGKAKPV